MNKLQELKKHLKRGKVYRRADLSKWSTSVDRHLDELVTTDAYAFASDSLFCEWAYVIDYDKNSFEVYKGLNTVSISEEDRFFPLYDGENDYYPVKIIASFPLDDLPDENEFLLRCQR